MLAAAATPETPAVVVLDSPRVVVLVLAAVVAVKPTFSVYM